MKRTILLLAAFLSVCCARPSQAPDLVQEGDGQPYVIEGQLTGLPGKGIMEVHNAWDGWTPRSPASTVGKFSIKPR